MKNKILNRLNVFSTCTNYDIPIYRCPQFLFLIMGTVIIITTLLSYIIGTHYISNPSIVALVVFFMTVFLFILSYFITQSFERLADLARIKSGFVSIVSHQLRSPVSNLKWTIELLLSGKVGELSEDQVEYLNILKQNTNRMGDMLKDLLIVSSIEEKPVEAKRERVSLKKITKDVILNYKSVAESSNVKINLKAPKELPVIYADPFELKVVVEKLLDNAIRYKRKREEERVEIKIKPQKNKIYFEIKDNGIGIPKKDKKHVFKKFFRSSNARQNQTLGTGLGLYIVGKIIKKIGGKIDFKSQKDEGSTFWFKLPTK